MSHTFLVGRDSVVLDIGANQGFYSMLAAAHGCRVVSFEPQPECQRGLLAARARNGFTDAQLRLVPRPVSARPRDVVVSSGARVCALMYTPFASGGRVSLELPAPHNVISTTVGEVLPPATSVRLAKVDARRGG